jgi:hypothetical protein
MADSLNKFMYGTNDDASLRAELVAITNLLGCNSEYQQWVSYFNNPANIAGMKEAQTKYGIPKRNRESYHTGLGIFGKWHDFCDWGDVFTFYYYSKISQDYPTLNPKVKSNCNIIKGYIQGLENEKVNVDKEFTIRNDNDKRIRQLEVLNDKLNDYNSLYANMNCDVWIADQERIKVEEARTKALKQSQESNISVYKQTAEQSATGTTKIALYVLGGVAILISIMIFTRKKV